MRSFLFSLLILFAAPLQAHRLPEALTTIEFNQNSGLTEIVHHLHAHDTSVILKKRKGEKRVSYDSLEGRARIALYVAERFAIALQDSDDELELKVIGAELEDGTLYVYQEYDGRLPKSIRVRNTVMQDLFREQVNTVNVKFDSKVQTLIFKKGDGWKRLP